MFINYNSFAKRAIHKNTTGQTWWELSELLIFICTPISRWESENLLWLGRESLYIKSRGSAHSLRALWSRGRWGRRPRCSQRWASRGGAACCGWAQRGELQRLPAYARWLGRHVGQRLGRVRLPRRVQGAAQVQPAGTWPRMGSLSGRCAPCRAAAPFWGARRPQTPSPRQPTPQIQTEPATQKINHYLRCQINYQLW